MTDRWYVRTKTGHSWHVVETATRAPGRYLTLCGKDGYGDTLDVLPAAKSCETCLRIQRRLDELREDDASTWPESVP